MTVTPKDTRKPGTETPAKPARRQEREARLAEALRANLKRRKAQERGRAAGRDASEDKDAADKKPD